MNAANFWARFAVARKPALCDNSPRENNLLASQPGRRK
jgi:hypothetical protein